MDRNLILNSLCLGIILLSVGNTASNCAQATEFLSQKEMEGMVGAGCDEICGGDDGQTKSSCGDDICYWVTWAWCILIPPVRYGITCYGEISVSHAVCDSTEYNADCDEVDNVTCANIMVSSLQGIGLCYPEIQLIRDCQCDLWSSSLTEEGC